MTRIAFLFSESDKSQSALDPLVKRYGQCDPRDADVIVALGGDGFMLHALHQTRVLDKPVYGMNRGTVGFLMNPFQVDDLPERLAKAEEAIIHPLEMLAQDTSGKIHEALAINEVSLFRSRSQAANLKITIGGRPRLEELVCDGAIIATPAGSTAYNYSAHGPILPIGSNVLALTAVAAFRPRRWQGAIVPMSSVVRIEVLDTDKRPVTADADGRNSVPNVEWVEVRSSETARHRLLFDPDHGLEERLMREQFL